MKKILIFASSINGYIAESDDSTGWSSDEWNAYIADSKRVWNMIMGRKTYEIMMKDGGIDTLGLRNLIIISSHHLETPYQVSPSPEDAIEYLESLWEKEVIICGGYSIATYLLDEWLLDEIILDIDPVIISEGVPIFWKLSNIPKLKLIELKKLWENTVRLHYQIL